MRKLLLNRWMILVTIITVFLFIGPHLSRAQSSPGHTLKTYALSGAGNKTASADYILISTLGQASPVGISSSNHFVHYAGFWLAVQLKQMLFLPLILRE